jgi:hypothetical protein
VDRLKALLWLAPPVFVILTMAEWKTVGFGIRLILLMLLNVLVIALMGKVLLRTIDTGARRWVGIVLGAGNITPAPSFSAQESLIVRGHYREAERAFQTHLESHPEDHDARLALADLYHRHLQDPAAAIRLYNDVRKGRPTPRQEASAYNQLIDLYQATGQRGQLMSELARFAARYRGTRAAEDARRRLEDLKQGT